MKNISNYNAEKYGNNEKYSFVEDGIYFFKNTDDPVLEKEFYVTSLSFEQELHFDEGDSPQNISQYPLEDILDKFNVRVNDFYREINEQSGSLCYTEFASPDIDDIKELRGIIGKHVYNKEDDNGVDLVITDYKDLPLNIKDDVFGEMYFRIGWNIKTEIELWGKSYTVTVTAIASIEDAVTDEQRKSYASFKETQAEKQKKIEELLSSEFEDEAEEEGFHDSFQPVTLLIRRSGDSALLFCDADFTVFLSPEVEISWDEF
ncbi:MAG: hypothetical protein FWG44_06330 [Oscillospiraceae bacterium]|nr:hypothetical protein [Oscillospiraceae bacterium]